MSSPARYIRTAILGALLCTSCRESPVSLPEMPYATVTGTVAGVNAWKELARVTIQGSGTGSDLDSNGMFRLFGVPFGSHCLSIVAYVSDSNRMWSRDTLIDISVGEPHVDIGVIRLLSPVESAAASSPIRSIQAIYKSASIDTWSPAAVEMFRSTTRRLEFGEPLYLSSDTARIMFKVADSCAQTCAIEGLGTPVDVVMRVGSEILTDWMYIPDSTNLTVNACGTSTQITLVNGRSRWDNSLNIYTGAVQFYRPDQYQMSMDNPLLVPYRSSLLAVSRSTEDSVDFDLLVHKVNPAGPPDTCVAADTSGLIVRIRENRTPLYRPPSPSVDNLERGAYRVYIRNAGGVHDSSAIRPQVNFVMGQFCLYKPRVAVNFVSIVVTRAIRQGETRLLGVVRFPECTFSAQ